MCPETLKNIVSVLSPISGLIGTLLMVYSKDVETNQMEPFVRFLSRLKAPSGPDVEMMNSHEIYHNHNNRMRRRREIGLILIVLSVILGIIAIFI